jgi:hypothetical protein
MTSLPLLPFSIVSASEAMSVIDMKWWPCNKNIFISSPDGEAQGKIATFSSVQEAALVRFSVDLASL